MNLPAALGGRVARWAEAAAPLLVLLVLGVVISLRTENFLARDNLANVVTRNVPLALIAVGQTLVIISGQIDLSVGSVMALCAVTAALLLQAGQPVAVAVLAAVLVGVTCGAVNAVVTIRAKIPAFITTLAMMGLARGVALLISDSRTVSGAMALRDVVLSDAGGVKLPVWLLLFSSLAFAVALAHAVFGRNAYATGSNPQAARLSGVRVDRNIVVTFMLCGLMVGLAGAVECGRNGSAQPTMGELKELDSIAAAVIGGASLTGGQGSVGGSLIGVAIMAVIENGCNLLNIPNQWQKIIVGPLIVVAVLYDRFIRRRRRVE